ncbi:MAG: hypothetical protein O7F08_02520, partial [Deltaproteobacteria bacterium]|nr:hypothetical protein [Deltaproteobacteria bacterium]
MQGRYPNHIVILVEGLVGPLDADQAGDWMRARAQTLRRETDVSAALVYQKLRSSGTMAKPRFLTVFETNDPQTVIEGLSAPYDHEALRPLGIGSFELLPGLPRADAAEPDGGLMVGLTNCTNPDDDADFNDWYNRMHAADVIKSPWFWNAQRYRKRDGDLPQYAALYETSLGGSEALKNYMG